jgi:hypothetical protein
MFPLRELLEQFAEIAPLIENPIVDDAFREREAAAVAAKRAYHLRGRLGMLLVLFSVLFTLAAAFVLPAELPPLRLVSIAIVVIGAAGLAIQVQLLLSGEKTRWLLNRFAAERIRSIKFQAYQFCDVADSKDDLQIRIAAFFTRELGRLNAELNAGEAALVMFSPAAAVVRAPSANIPRNTDLAILAHDAYRELRLDYQRRFATGEIRALGSLQRIGYASADLLYFAGAGLTVATVITKLSLAINDAVGHWIDFLALACFVCGLAQSILENASLGETSKIRYETYLHELDDCSREIVDDGATFIQGVHRMERVILGELAQFCQAASQISYRL